MSAGLPEWQLRAACADRPDLDWFSQAPAEIAAVKAVCTGCAAQGACLAWALDTGEPEGVWGGQSAADRLEPLLLADPEPTPHVASRGCYVTNHCRLPECTALNTAYQADLRHRPPATAQGRVDVGEQLVIGEDAA